MKRLRFYISLLAMAILSACSHVPKIASGSIFRYEIATRSSYEKVLSYSELNRLAKEYPFWEQVDSASIDRMNLQLGKFKPWKPDWAILNDTLPGFLDRCRNKTSHFFFNYPHDTIRHFSPFHGSDAEVIDQECLCLRIGPEFLVHGKTHSGDSLIMFIGRRVGRNCVVWVNGKFFIHEGPYEDEGMPNWLYGWRPKVMPPALQNWPKKYIKSYEDANRKQ